MISLLRAVRAVCGHAVGVRSRTRGDRYPVERFGARTTMAADDGSEAAKAGSQGLTAAAAGIIVLLAGRRAELLREADPQTKLCYTDTYLFFDS